MEVRIGPALGYLTALGQGLGRVEALESHLLRLLARAAQIKEVSLDPATVVRAIVLPEADHVGQLGLHVVHLGGGVHVYISIQT